MTLMRTFMLVLLLLAGAVVTFAQVEQAVKSPAPPDPTVTISISARGVRFAALGQFKQTRLEVFTASGDSVYNSGFQSGNVRDWALEDKLGQRLPDGSYLCVVTIRDVSGRMDTKHGTVLLQGGQASLKLGEGGKVGVVEPEQGLTTVADGSATALTIVAHDGQEGQVVSTRGPLSFRIGDFFSGKDTEQMRLTEEGNLGLGTDSPQARLDVNGLIRARSGIQFNDGSILNLAPKGGGLRVTLPSGATTAVNLAPSAVAGTANYIAKFANDGSSLQDSVIYQSAANGYIGIGTNTPAHPFVVRRNGGTLGVHSVGEFFVDRDDRTRSASLTVGTAGTLKWIFGMPSGNDGFQVYDLISNQSRFFVDPTSGNIGIGNTSPQSKLDVGGDLKVSGNAVVAGNIAAKYQDIAEWVPSQRKLAAGTVVSLDAARSNAVAPSYRPYDTHVAGVISAQPGMVLGEGGEGKVLVATTGRVKVRVDATRHPIKIGDLLVTSSKPGVAMRSQPIKVGGSRIHRPGTIIGKALEPLVSGQGEILVLLSLQ
jgi:hypothetical protein